MVPLSPVHPPIVVNVNLNLLFTMAFAMNGIASNKLPSGPITYLIRHLFLPPKLPHEDDFNSEYETIMLDTTVDGLLKFKSCAPSDQSGIIDSVIAMITSLRTVCDSFGTEGAVSEEKLGNALMDLCKKGRNSPHDYWELS